MVTRLDDYPHAVGPEANFNESMYFQFHDPTHGISGFLRLANRPNEGTGERTVCLFLPNGRLGFGFERPRITGNTAMSAAGLIIDVVEPMERLRVGFDGVVHLLGDPTRMVDPKAALAESSTVDCHVELEYTALAPAHEQTFDGPGGSFAPNHYEQLAAVNGTVKVGESAVAVRGHGLRDHSWGPRSWQAPWFYRWLHASSETLGFMVAYFGDPDGSSRRGGFVFDDGRLHPCYDTEITTLRDSDDFPSSIQVVIRGTDRRWRFTGDAIASVPLRHRSADRSTRTRIVETTMRWRGEDGQELHGMAEYLDQIREGLPVGQRV